MIRESGNRETEKGGVENNPGLPVSRECLLPDRLLPEEKLGPKYESPTALNPPGPRRRKALLPVRTRTRARRRTGREHSRGRNPGQATLN